MIPRVMIQILALLGRYWPLRRGTGWLVERPARLIKDWPKNQCFRLKDGRIFQGDLNDNLFRSLYLYGTYEPVVSAALSQLVHPGDVVVDVGANIGVITALLGKLVSPSGRVYSFEPVPPSFDKLRQTITLNHLENVVQMHPVAVSDGEQASVTIYMPIQHSHACSSSRIDDQKNAIPYLCESIALDNVYFIQGAPALVKVDVEGAELSVLSGAEQLCRSSYPPIWVIEVNHKTAGRFDYRPEDIPAWLEERQYIRFYWSDESNFHLYQVGDAFSNDGTIYALPEWAIQDGRNLKILL
jgi:FkbM family methyltransferase